MGAQMSAFDPQSIELAIVMLFALLASWMLVVRRREDGGRSKSASCNIDYDCDFVAALDSLRLSDVSSVGGKAANLGELRNWCSLKGKENCGGAVPRGFAVTASAFRAYERGKDVSMILEQVGDAYDASGLGCVAVRSSAVGEDSAGASFAGQLETYLGISGREAVSQAVVRCWKSASADRVRAYSKDRTDAGAVGVVVQEMVDASRAGVCFTANPVSGKRDEVVVTANFGIGESVVADLSTPDTWIVRRSLVVRRDIATKTRMVVLPKPEHKSGSKEAETVDVPESIANDPSLSEKQVLRIAALARTIEDHYGCPQDIEWAIDGEGTIRILQARPITTLPPSGNRGIGSKCTSLPPAAVRWDDWITTCNASEMFPGAGTPLTQSTFGAAIDRGMQALQVDFGIRDAVDASNQQLCCWFSHHLFINMTNVFLICAGMLGGQLGKTNGEMSILGRPNAASTLERIVEAHGGYLPLHRRAINGLRYLRTMLLAPRRISRMIGRIEEARAAFLRIIERKEDADAAEIWERIDAFMPSYREQWADGIATSSTSAAWAAAAMKMLATPAEPAWSPALVAKLASLLRNDGDVAESADALVAIGRIRDAIFDQGDAAVSAFVNLTPERGVGWLRSSSQGSERIAALFAELLRRHGHRAVSEAEMRVRGWESDPAPLVQLMQTLVKAGRGGNRGGKSACAVDFDSILGTYGMLRRCALRVILAKARSAVKLREEGKSLQIKAHSFVKKAYVLLAERLVEAGALAEIDDVYFLEHEEVGRLARRELDHCFDVNATIASRREAFERDAMLVFDDLHCGVPLPRSAFDASAGAADSIISGTPVSTGVAEGKACVVRTLDDANKLRAGEILVCVATDVGWTPYFSLARAVVTEVGGMLSHGAVVAREYGLPCVVNAKGACVAFADGATIRVDGDRGVVEKL